MADSIIQKAKRQSLWDDFRNRTSSFLDSGSRKRTLAVLILVFVIQYKVIWSLPILKWDLPGNLPVYLARLTSMASSLFFIWLFAPNALKRFRIGFKGKSSAVVLGALMAFLTIGYFSARNQNLAFLQLMDGAVFSLFIGLDEEFFDRGLIFGLLERHGTEFALAVSALIFGGEHFMNFLSGEDSFDYVLGHMVSAASYGYLMAAMMLLFRNIWVPAIVHAASDFSWVIMDPKQSSTITLGGTDWRNILLTSLVHIALARFMIYSIRRAPNLNSVIGAGHCG